MLTREDLHKTEEYWLERTQNEIFRMVYHYKEENNLTLAELAKELGMSHWYVSRLLNGNFNSSYKNLIKLCLKLGIAPQLDLTMKLHEYTKLK